MTIRLRLPRTVVGSARIHLQAAQMKRPPKRCRTIGRRCDPWGYGFLREKKRPRSRQSRGARFASDSDIAPPASMTGNPYTHMHAAAPDALSLAWLLDRASASALSVACCLLYSVLCGMLCLANIM
jgi:hypothetical protein